MLSFLAQSQNNFRLNGTCPVPTRKSAFFVENYALTHDYYTALHYNSESKGQHVFGAERRIAELNCLNFSFKNISYNILSMFDCEHYEASMVQVADGSYNVVMENKDMESTCKGEKVYLKGLHVWSDKKNEFILFWSCTNHTQSLSHKQVAIVFVNGPIVLRNATGHVDTTVFSRLKKFSQDMLAFSGLTVDEFDVNERLMLKLDHTCDFYNCTNTCEASGEEEGSYGGPLIFFAVIGFLIVIICMVLL